MTDSEHARMAWIAVAGLAGSITGLSFMPWKSMSMQERVLTLTVGLSFAVFGVPWLVVDFVKVDLTTLRAACGAAYMGGTVANAVLPILIRKAGAWLGRFMDRVLGTEGETK